MVDSQARTSATVRPSTWPNSPPLPCASTNPGCQRSRVSCHFPVSGSCSQRCGRAGSRRCPAPEPRGSGASITLVAAVRKASITADQDRARSRAACTTVDPASRTRRPAAHRNRSVNRAPAGICGICSVNDFRGQDTSRHHQRRLCHTNSRWRSPYGRSRGRVAADPFTRDAKTPHTGQALAEASVVARWIRRVPSSSRSTRMTDTASRSSSDVVSLTKPEYRNLV